MKIILVGRGKMGTLLESTAKQNGDEIVSILGREEVNRLAAFEKTDMIIYFSGPDALEPICDYVRRTGTSLLSGTTGYCDKQFEKLRSLGECAPVLWSANYSLGIAVFEQVLRQISDVLKSDFDIEIEETHHRQKADAPSGTAKLLLSAIDPNGEFTPVYGREGNLGRRDGREIGVHALRGGTVAGTHTVHFFGQDEELEITHRATSRQIFVNGALHAAHLLSEKENGYYNLQGLLFHNKGEV